MQAAKSKIEYSRIVMGAMGLFLAAWGSAAIADYVLPGWFWRLFLVLAMILLGVFGKAVYDRSVH